jgi:uncharacterized protein YjbJ (UPF0337 family)
MNKEQVRSAADTVVGKTKEVVGRASGNKEFELAHDL